jgi:hypothetical protein
VVAIPCCHESCGFEERIWLPERLSTKSDVALHQWCVLCGVIRNISDDRPKKIGFWINVLSRIAKRFSLTETQKRLMVKEIESNECFEDLYGTTGSAQREVFIKAIEKYCNLGEATIASYIY